MYKKVEMQPWSTIKGTVNPGGAEYPIVTLEPQLWVDTSGYTSCSLYSDVALLDYCKLRLLGINEGDVEFTTYGELTGKTLPTTHVICDLSKNWPEGDARKLREKLLWSVENVGVPYNGVWTATFKIMVALHG